MIKRRAALVWIILAFLAGVLVCHLFYYSTSSYSERKIRKEIERLKEEYSRTQQEIEKIDSVLNQLQ